MKKVVDEISPFRLLCPFAFSVARSERPSSDSVVCFVTLRPLRSLREIKDNSVFVLHAECAKSAEIYFPSVFHACAGVLVNFVTTRVRREFYPPPPPCGVLPLSQG